MKEIQSYPLDLQRLQFFASLLHHQKVESNRLKCFHGLDNQTQTKIQDFEQNSFLEKTNISRFLRILKFKNVHKNTSSIVLSKKNCAHFILLSQIPGRARNTPAESQELAMQLGHRSIHSMHVLQISLIELISSALSMITLRAAIFDNIVCGALEFSLF